MSKNGSKREFIFNCILQQNPELLGQFIGNVKLLELEYDSEKWVDIYGRDLNHNSPIYIESQLGSSDEDHLGKVKKLLETNQNESGIFIWIASKFKDDHLVEVEKLSELYAKGNPISILALSMQKDYLKVLDKLNRKMDLEIWEEINQKDFVLPQLSVVGQWGDIPAGFQESSVTASKWPQDLTLIDAINSYLLSILRKEVPYLLNVHRAKKITVNPIVFGSGRSDFSFVINLAACEVAIRLEQGWQSSLFQEVVSQFKENRDFATVRFEDKKVVFPIVDLDDTQEKVKMATKLFKTVVDVAIPVIYFHSKRFPTY